MRWPALLIFSLLSVPQGQAKSVGQVAYGREWIKLLHYQSRLNGKFESLVDGPGFFLAKNGRSDPLAELRANLEILADSKSKLKIGKLKQHPQCAFPLRFKFLRQKFRASFLPQRVPCKKLDEFMEKFSHKKIFYVFSSSYANNPASMFGHTFLRVANADRGAPSVLDYGISYAAFIPPGDGGAIFAVKGVFGGYPGLFSVIPYYVKLNEYSNVEGRDIWEYELNLSAEEVKNLLLHTWEIEANSYFDYYFFDENCAYHLLALIEVVRPSVELTDYFLYMTPADSVKKLVEVSGLVKKVHFRPSLLRQGLADYRKLTRKQKTQFEKAVLPSQDISSLKSEKVLDNAIDYLRYRKQVQGAKNFKEVRQKRLDQLLVHRNQLPSKVAPKIDSKEASKTTSPIDKVKSTRPDLGHDPHLFKMGIGKNRRSKNFWKKFRYQTSYHDLLANDLGYGTPSALVFPSIELKYSRKRWSLQEFTMAKIISLSPWNRFSQEFSWALEARLYQDDIPLECREKTCLLGQFYIARGISHYFLKNTLLFSAMLGLNGEAGKTLSKKYGGGPQFHLWLLTSPHPSYKNLLSFQQSYDLKQEYPSRIRRRWQWGHSVRLKRNLELRAIWMGGHERKGDRFNQVELSLLVYTL
ncbi:MAG: DUF4105 domain-containing protein [Bacteriovoracales bacterium]|nr:DUF4105 domain-containing protein [Bacteriovoracales bacterium]